MPSRHQKSRRAQQILAAAANIAATSSGRRGRPARPRRNHEGRRSTADKVLAQGTGRAVSLPFGTTSVPRSLSSGLPAGAWDAFDSSHAPLPRSVGPYTVVRTSMMIQGTASQFLFGTFQIRDSHGQPNWSNVAMASSNLTTGVIGTTNNTFFNAIAFPGGSPQTATVQGQTTFTCCPAALSVQLMGNKSLSESHGQLAACVIPARCDLANDTRTWDAISTNFVSYFRPRLLTAGKLALRGVQMNSHPLSMADVSEFLPMLTKEPGTSNNEAWTDASPHPVGWAPIMVYNPDNAHLTFMVSIEWRVRFDVGNPAVASHQHHGVSSDFAWDKKIQQATNALPGVVDIVEKVANAGLGLYRATQRMPLPAIGM